MKKSYLAIGKIEDETKFNKWLDSCNCAGEWEGRWGIYTTGLDINSYHGIMKGDDRHYYIVDFDSYRKGYYDAVKISFDCLEPGDKLCYIKLDGAFKTEELNNVEKRMWEEFGFPQSGLTNIEKRSFVEKKDED